MRRTAAILLVALAIVAWAVLVSPSAPPAVAGGATAPPGASPPDAQACLQVWMSGGGGSEAVEAPDATVPAAPDAEAALRARVRAALLGGGRP